MIQFTDLVGGVIGLFVRCYIVLLTSGTALGQGAGDEGLYQIPLSAIQTSRELVKRGAGEEGRRVAKMVFETAKEAYDGGDASALNTYILGVTAALLDQQSLSIHYLQYSIRKDPSNFDAQQTLARAYMDSGSNSHALDQLVKYASHFEGNEAYQLLLLELYTANGHTAEAAMILNTLWHKDKTNQRLFNRLLEQYTELGEMDKVALLFDEIIMLGKLDVVDKLVYLANMCLDEADLGAARRNLQQARSRNPDHPSLGRLYSRYYDLSAEEANRIHQYSRAILFWERSLEYEPENTAVQRKLGAAYGKVGDYDKLLEVFEGILEARPSDPEFYLDYAKALHATGNIRESYELLQSVLHIARVNNDQRSMKLFVGLQDELLAIDQARLEEQR